MKQTDIDIEMNFGDETEQTKLISTELQIRFGKQAAKSMQKQLGYISEKQNDIHVFIQFYVPQGRQKEAVQYLQRSMDEPDQQEKQHLSPLQNLLLRPKSTGKVTFQQKPGIVKVHYCIYDEYTFERFQQFTIGALKKINEQKIAPIINFRGEVRGQQSQSIKQKTQIWGNYVHSKFKIHNFSPKLIFQTLQQLKQQDDDFFSQLRSNPLLNLLLFGCRKIKLDYNFVSFRNIASIYKQACQYQQKRKPQAYINKGLIKNKIIIQAVVPKIGSVRGTTEFSNQGALQRFIKVFYHAYAKSSGSFKNKNFKRRV